MKQELGLKKKKLIYRLTGKIYKKYYTSAKFGHFIAECWIDEKNADYVNYRTKFKGRVQPKIRNGELVRPLKVPVAKMIME